MSVLVKGMKMPDSCAVCRFAGKGGYFMERVVCMFTGKNEDAEKINRLPECPLVDLGKHGDLIDRDALEQEMLNGIKAGNLEEGYEMYANINTVDDCVECVRLADAVIEAEDGE